MMWYGLDGMNSGTKAIVPWNRYCEIETGEKMGLRV